MFLGSVDMKGFHTPRLKNHVYCIPLASCMGEQRNIYTYILHRLKRILNGFDAFEDEDDFPSS